MPECECLKGCPYFNAPIMKEFDAMAQLRKQRYCLGSNSDCARYQVFKALGKIMVPADLLPSQVERAKEIINGNSV